MVGGRRIVVFIVGFLRVLGFGEKVCYFFVFYRIFGGIVILEDVKRIFFKFVYI